MAIDIYANCKTQQERYDLNKLLALIAIETLTVSTDTYCAYNDIPVESFRLEMASIVCSIYALKAYSDFESKHLPAALSTSQNVPVVLDLTRKNYAAKLGLAEKDVPLVTLLSHLDSYAIMAAEVIRSAKSKVKK